MKHVVGELGIHGIVFTKVRRPMGHGKIEAFNRLIVSAFLAELDASSIKTLDALNEAWLAWTDLHYNVTIHGETGEKPRDRWRRRIADVKFADEAKLRAAFLWKEDRTPDKSGVFSLFGVEYQVGHALAKKRIEVRYDPECLDLVEAWFDDKLVERVKPFVVSRHRRPHPTPELDVAAKPKPKVKKPAESSVTKPAAKADWLGHLTQQRRKQNLVEPSPRALADSVAQKRAEADAAVFDVIAARMDPAVADPPSIRAFLQRFGPWDPLAVADLVDGFLTVHPKGTHIQVLLDNLRTQLEKDSTP